MKVELNIPEGLHEITLEQYQQYIELTEKLQDNPEGLKQAAISCFCRVPMSTVRFIRAVDVDAIYNQFIEYFKQKPPMQPIIKIGDEVFGFEPDLQNMDYGAYLDLDSNITTWANYHKALAVMYRPIVKNKGNKYQIQQYEGTANYSEVMKHVTLDVVFGANVFFLSFRKRLTERFDGLFTQADENERVSDFSEEGQFAQRWGWYQTIYILAKGDVTKFDQVTREPLFKCLTLLMFEKEKADIEYRRLQRQMNKGG